MEPNNLLAKIKNKLPETEIISAPEVKIKIKSLDLACFPKLIIYPRKKEEIANIMIIATQENIPVYVLGGGTGMFWKARDCRAGMLVSLKFMNQIKEINTRDNFIIVEAGMINQQVQETVEEYGLYFPINPGSAMVSTIGGNIAEDAVGLRGSKYGSMRDYVLEFEAVTPRGEVISSQTKTIKSLSKQNMVNLFSGSGGKLGIITQAKLHLLPLPPARLSLLVSFNNISSAAQAFCSMVEASFAPTGVELLDQEALISLQQSPWQSLPIDAEAVLLVEAEGGKDEVKIGVEDFKHICEMYQAKSIEISDDKHLTHLWWEARGGAYLAMIDRYEKVAVTNITVPRRKVPQVLPEIKKLYQALNIRVSIFGHCGGQGTLHCLGLFSDKEEAKNTLPNLYKQVETLIKSYGGYIHSLVPVEQRSQLSIEALQQVKAVLDPAGILNP